MIIDVSRVAILEPEGEPSLVTVLLSIAFGTVILLDSSGSRQIVNDPMNTIILADSFMEECCLLFAELLFAEHPTAHVVVHVEFIWRVFYPITPQNLAKVFCRVADRVGFTKGKRVVVERKLG